MPAEFIPEYMGYDRTIAVFSPDGRLLQVEYAKEAVKKGVTSIGVTFREGVILATVRSKEGLEKLPVEKLFAIDEHVGAVASGFLADARIVVELARVRAQVHRVTYGEKMDVYNLARVIGDRFQYSTLIAGLRPFGVGILVGGWDKKGEHLFEIDPSGIIFGWEARGIGRGANIANRILQQKWKKSLSEKEAINLVKEIFSRCEKKFDVIDLLTFRKEKKFEQTTIK